MTSTEEFPCWEVSGPVWTLVQYFNSLTLLKEKGRLQIKHEIMIDYATLEIKICINAMNCKISLGKVSILKDILDDNHRFILRGEFYRKKCRFKILYSCKKYTKVYKI